MASMGSHQKHLIFSAAACALMAGTASAQTGAAPGLEEETLALDRIIVAGSREKAEKVPGAVTYIDADTLTRLDYSDVGRVLRLAPGVFVQDEEGFGLRPNIGIRGSGTDRSERVLIMEDGVPVAPAPYSAAAAYYFPSMARMSGVEVVKGAGAIKYGPRTVGGTLQMFSTPIPDSPGGRVSLLGGSDNGLKAHGHVGGFTSAGGIEVGGMIEYLHESSDGFKRLDRGGDTGYQIDDIVAKLAFRTGDGAALPQRLELKYQTSEQDSDETYLGLTEADFAADPYRRYNGSQLDNIIADHTLYQATHTIDFGSFDVTTTAYRTETARAWYKLNDVRDAGTAYVSLANVLDNPALYPTAYANLVGADGYVSANDVLRVRNNNRIYEAQGIQSVVGFEFDAGPTSHAIEVSARYHEDEEDRFQQDDRYRIENGTMVLTTAGAAGSQDNRVGSAEAWSFFVRDDITFGKLTLSPGVRYESIRLERVNYSTADPSRTGPTTGSSSEIDVWIPGAALLYQATDALALYAGVHKGFANPAPGSSADAEESVNWEAGLRYGDGALRAEATAFYNDYENLVGTCTASTGGGCNIGDQFDGGAATIRGLEMNLGYEASGALGLSGVKLPLALIYTYTDSEFGSSFTSGFWGTVVKGDELPYLPDHQLTADLGVETGPWQFGALINYASETRTNAGSGSPASGDRVDARTLVDLTAAYELSDGVRLKLRAENAFDETYNVGYLPSGARPGKPQTVWAGIDIRF